MDGTLGHLQFLFRIAAGTAGAVAGIRLPSKVAPSPSSRERKDMRTVVPALHTQPVLTFPTTLPSGVGDNHLCSMSRQKP